MSPWYPLVRYFVEYPLIGIFLMFFSRLDSAMGLGEEDHKGKVPFSSHHVKGTFCQHNFSLMMLP